jgi:hypothetical protein
MRSVQLRAHARCSLEGRAVRVIEASSHAQHATGCAACEGMHGASARTMSVLPLVYHGRSASCSAMPRRMACAQQETCDERMGRRGTHTCSDQGVSLRSMRSRTLMLRMGCRGLSSISA